MKEIRELHLSKFQKEIINKLDDEYCYEIQHNGYINNTHIYILNKEKQFLQRIDNDDDRKSINDRIKKIQKEIKILELILEESK